MEALDYTQIEVRMPHRQIQQVVGITLVANAFETYGVEPVTIAEPLRAALRDYGESDESGKPTEKLDIRDCLALSQENGRDVLLQLTPELTDKMTRITEATYSFPEYTHGRIQPVRLKMARSAILQSAWESYYAERTSDPMFASLIQHAYRANNIRNRLLADKTTTLL